MPLLVSWLKSTKMLIGKFIFILDSHPAYHTWEYSSHQNTLKVILKKINLYHNFYFGFSLHDKTSFISFWLKPHQNLNIMQVLSIKSRSLMKITLSRCNRKQSHPGKLMKVNVGKALPESVMWSWRISDGLWFFLMWKHLESIKSALLLLYLTLRRKNSSYNTHFLPK